MTKWIFEHELPTFGIHLKKSARAARAKAGTFPKARYDLGGGRAAWREDELIDFRDHPEHWSAEAAAKRKHKAA